MNQPIEREPVTHQDHSHMREAHRLPCEPKPIRSEDVTAAEKRGRADYHAGLPMRVPDEWKPERMLPLRAGYTKGYTEAKIAAKKAERDRLTRLAW